MTLKIKGMLKKFPIVMIPYKKVKGIILGVRNRKKIEAFVKNGEDVIFSIQQIFEELNLTFFFDMGTLLGIYRDKQLIKRDMDVDVGVFVEDHKTIQELRKFLASKGFVHRYVFCTDSYGVIQDSYDYKEVRIDICYYRKEKDRDVCYLLYDTDEQRNLIVELSCHHIEKTVKTNFNGIKVSIPADTEKYLKDRYGDNWRIPDKGYIYWKGPSARKVDGIGECEQLA